MTTPSPFQAGPEVMKRGALARFFRVGAKSSAQQDLVNLLARTRLSEITPDTVSRILEEHKVTAAGARAILKDLWTDAVLEFVKDDVLSDDEMAYLGELRHVLTLSTTESEAALEEAVNARYGLAIREAVADGKATADERDRLERLAAGLRLSEQARAKLNKLHVEEYASRQAKVIGADQRASPEELQQLDQLGAALGVDIQLDSSTTATLARYHHLWLIENGQPRPMSVDIALQKGEEAYFMTAARWAELRTKTVQVSYSGPTASIRIMKGVRWRVGTITPHRITEEQFTVLDSGRLYITNKRVIFRGAKRNVALPLKALLGIRVFADGIQLEKATGRSPFALFDGDIELAATLLTSLLASS
jgi:hypothetical protein